MHSRLFENKHIFYTRNGTSSHAIIYIHGDGQNHTSGTELLKQFPKHTHLALDRPGHGESQELPHRTLDQEAAIVEKIIEHEKITQLTIIAHSSGTAVALTYALAHPVHALVLLDPFFLDPKKVFWYLPIRWLEKGYIKKVTGQQRKHTFGNEKSEAELSIVVLANNSPATLKRNLDSYEAYDVRGNLHRLACPVLIVCSTKGMFSFRKHIAKESKRIRHVRIVPLKTTHNLHLLHKETLASILKANHSFLAL
jgi:pimeloyl-ACP methyl ester carboxylesterase